MGLAVGAVAGGPRPGESWALVRKASQFVEVMEPFVRLSDRGASRTRGIYFESSRKIDLLSYGHSLAGLCCTANSIGPKVVHSNLDVHTNLEASVYAAIIGSIQYE